MVLQKKIFGNKIFQEKLENIWETIAAQVSTVLASDIALPEEEHPLPFDAISDKSMDDQK